MTAKFDGCGPKWLAGWIHIPQWHSHEHCVEHDIAYRKGGTEGDRARADRALLRGMMSDAATRPSWQRPWYRLQAVNYFVWCRCAGWLSFHYRPRNLAALIAAEKSANPLRIYVPGPEWDPLRNIGPAKPHPIDLSSNPMILGTVQRMNEDGTMTIESVSLVRREDDQS